MRIDPEEKCQHGEEWDGESYNCEKCDPEVERDAIMAPLVAELIMCRLSSTKAHSLAEYILAASDDEDLVAGVADLVREVVRCQSPH